MRKYDKKDIFLALFVVNFAKVVVFPGVFDVVSLAILGTLTFFSEYFTYGKKVQELIARVEEQDKVIRETKEIVSSIRLTTLSNGRNSVIFGK